VQLSRRGEGRLVGLLVAAALVLASAAAAQSLVIRGDTNLSGYAVKRDGTLFGAIEEFGDPSSLRRGRYRGQPTVTCIARWQPLGLKITFYNLGGQNPCRPQYGYFGEAWITSRQWRTASGLRVGHPWRYILRYHPRARPGGTRTGWWWLVTRYTPIGTGGPYAALAARVKDGYVVVFRVRYAAGGDY
jgi:hypothetical protein